MAQPAACSLCNERVKTPEVPLDVLMMITDGISPVICRSCVNRQNIPVEHLNIQDRLWYNGKVS